MGLLDRAVERLKEEKAAEADAASAAPVASPGVDAPLPAMPVPEADPAAEQRSGRGAPRFRLDGDALARRGFLVPGAPMDPGLLEEYRRIKRDLLLTVAAAGVDDEYPIPRSNVVTVTSSLDGEGKTFVTVNLAFSIALEVDRTALLLDGDVIRRGASRLLGVDDRPGFIDLLAGDVDDLSDVIIRPENVPNLRVIPAGRPRDNLNELLASQRAEAVLEEISERYRDRVALIDSPPMLLTSEATVLARLAGLVLVVVEADRTPHQSVEQTLEMVDEDRLAGLVLNRASRHLGTGGYGYYEYRDE